MEEWPWEGGLVSISTGLNLSRVSFTITHHCIPASLQPAPSMRPYCLEDADPAISSPSFPSQPARCYLHLIKTDDVPSLSEIVQRSTWDDAKRTMNDSALVGPPYVEIAQFQKIPTAKKRTDPRQGTIDQDPEFQAFLQSLTQPTPTKEHESEQASEEAAAEDMKVTTTPLVQYLKEKKAIKAKEAANAKSAKHTRQESQSGKLKGTTEDSKKKSKDAKTDKSERQSEKEKDKDKEKDKPKEPVKLLTKKAATQEAAEVAKTVAAQVASSKPAEESAAPKSRRAGIAAAAKILQRDLGLSPGSAHRRARQDAAKAEAATKSDSGKDSKENKESVPITSAAEASASSPRPSTPTTTKASAAEGSRRSRNKTSKQIPSKEDAKSKGGESSNAATKPSAQSQPTPVILKRKDKEPNSSTAALPTPATTSAAAASTPTPTGPKPASGKSTSSKQGASASQKKSSSQIVVTAGATRAFLKHVNPSQGVTEALLKQAMEIFGTVTHIEIEKRKGFAYVDFSDHESLVKAIAGSPITVAQGNIQILERKETRKATPASQSAPEKEKVGAETQAPAQSQTPTERPKRGGRGRGRKGGADKNKDTTNDTAASASKAAPASSAETSAPAAPS